MARPQPEGEGGLPPKQPRMTFVRSLNQEMGGNPQDLRRTPPNSGRSGGKGGGARDQYGTGDGGGGPPPLGGRGTPEEQARAILARLILETPGGRPT